MVVIFFFCTTLDPLTITGDSWPSELGPHWLQKRKARTTLFKLPFTVVWAKTLNSSFRMDIQTLKWKLVMEEAGLHRVHSEEGAKEAAICSSCRGVGAASEISGGSHSGHTQSSMAMRFQNNPLLCGLQTWL